MSKNLNIIEAINELLQTEYSNMAGHKDSIITYVETNKVMLDDKMKGQGLPSPREIAKQILNTFPNVVIIGGRRRSSKSSKKQSARRRRSSKARKAGKARKSRTTRRR